MKSLAIKAHMLVSRAKDDRGATAVEYGLIVALIAVVIVVAVVAIGNNLSNTLNEVANSVK